MKNLKFILLLLVTAILFVADIAYGSVRIPLSELFSDNELYHNIIYNFRLPKALFGIEQHADILGNPGNHIGVGRTPDQRIHQQRTGHEQNRQTYAATTKLCQTCDTQNADHHFIRQN